MNSYPQIEQPVVTTAHFSDVRTMDQVSGWDNDFRQLDAGHVDISAAIRPGKYVSILKFSFNRAYHQRGQAPAGVLNFGIPLVALKDWYGQRFTLGQTLNFNHDSGFDCVSPTDFHGVTFTISEEFLVEVAEACHLPLTDKLLNPASGATVGTTASAGALINTIHSVLRSQSALNEEQQWGITADLLIAASMDESMQDKSKLSTRSKAAQAALTFIEEHSDNAITVSDICLNTGVAWRTLNRAFRERFEVTPKQYLQRQRLTRARGELIMATPLSGRVSDIANTTGFWHMGQFARDYHKLFGELPSVTLANSDS